MKTNAKKIKIKIKNKIKIENKIKNKIKNKIQIINRGMTVINKIFIVPVPSLLGYQSCLRDICTISSISFIDKKSQNILIIDILTIFIKKVRSECQYVP